MKNTFPEPITKIHRHPQQIGIPNKDYRKPLPKDPVDRVYIAWGKSVAKDDAKSVKMLNKNS